MNIGPDQVQTDPVCPISGDAADEGDAGDEGDAADEFREALFCRQAAYLEPICSESDVTYIISPLFRPRRVFFEVAEAPQGACRLETELLGIISPLFWPRCVFFEVAEAPQGACRLATQLLSTTNHHLNVWSIFRFSQNRLS